MCSSTSPVTATFSSVLGGAGDLRAVDDQGDGQRHLRAGLDLELLDLDHVTDRDLVLLAAGLDDRVRGFLGCHRGLLLVSGRALLVAAHVWVSGSSPVAGRSLATTAQIT